MTEPAWFTAAVDQRLQDAKLIKSSGPGAMFNIIMLPLTDRDEDTCDGCGKVVGQPLIHPGSTQKYHDKLEVHVIITFGVCPDCKPGFEGG